MNRRDFIQKVGAASVCLQVRGQSRRRVRAGVLGATHSHAAEKIRLLQGSEDYELIGISERSETVRGRFSNVQWMEEREVIEAAEVVFVESDVRDHPRHAVAVLKAGRHVHLEKPASTKSGEMEELARVAREGKLLMQTGYMWRYEPGFEAIFQARREGWLGEVYHVRGVMNNQLAANRRAEWAEFAGGAFFELASHLVDAVVRLMGRPKSVTPVLRSRLGDELMDNNVAVFEFPSGALATISNATHQPNASGHRSFEVMGTNGTMLLKPIEPPLLEVDLASASGRYKGGRQQVEMPEYRRYVGDLKDMAQAVRGGKLAVSLDEELLVQEWLLKASGMG